MLRALMTASITLMAALTLASQPTSASLLKKAEDTAKTQKKNVLVIFHASWCGWCKRLDAFLDDPQMGKLMKDSFVVVHLDVMEQGDKKSLENAGGEDLMKSWNGEGLPYTVILDPSGKRLVDSNSQTGKPSNIGYPAQPEEIAHFSKMLQFAPNMTASQRSQIADWLKEHAPSG